MSASAEPVIETCEVEDICYLSNLPPPPVYVSNQTHQALTNVRIR